MLMPFNLYLYLLIKITLSRVQAMEQQECLRLQSSSKLIVEYQYKVFKFSWLKKQLNFEWNTIYPLGLYDHFCAYLQL
jgi:hypothetical protein